MTELTICEEVCLKHYTVKKTASTLLKNIRSVKKCVVGTQTENYLHHCEKREILTKYYYALNHILLVQYLSYNEQAVTDNTIHNIMH